MSRRRALLPALAASLALTLAACGSDSTTDTAEPTGDASGDTTAAATDGKGSEDDPVVIGVVGASDPQWPLFEQLAEDEGIHVELTNFTDYPSINPALTEGTLDLNQFQHILYLAQYNNATDSDLTIVGDTAIYPMGVYSNEYEDVADIPDGGEITIPNDPTNQARALFLLQDAGLITLSDDAGTVPDPTDVDTANSRVTVTPVDANNVVTAITSVDATVVNNDYLADAGLKATDAIYLEAATSEGAQPYINIWAARSEDADNETYLTLVEIFDSPEVQEAVQDNADGSAIFANLGLDELARVLADEESKLAES